MVNFLARRFCIIILLYVTFCCIIFSSGCGISQEEKDFHRSTAENFRTIWQTADYLWSKLPPEQQKAYSEMRESFNSVVESAIERQFKFGELDDFEKFLAFMKQSQPQTQTKDSKGGE